MLAVVSSSANVSIILKKLFKKAEKHIAQLESKFLGLPFWESIPFGNYPLNCSAAENLRTGIAATPN